MVKGISRQVIVVHPPETDLFDQAIFILKDRPAEAGVTDEQLLRQARQAADSYLRSKAKGGRALGRRWKPLLFTLLGAAIVSILWGLSALLL